MSEAPSSIRARLAERKMLFDLVFEHNPVGIAVAAPDGALRFNATGGAILGALAPNEGVEKWSEQYGLFRADRTTRYPTEELPLVIALSTRQDVHDTLLFMRSAARSEGTWLSVSAFPLPDGGAVALFRDVTREAEVRERLEARRTALVQAKRDNEELIDRLRVALDELSTPVLELWRDVLALPVIGLVDSQRSAQMTERLLAEVTSRRARYVIVDLTGVAVLDTSTADRFVALARSVRMLGAECLITGIQPSVAQTMVSIGVDLGGIVTLRNLAHALERCMRRVGDTRDGRPARRALETGS